MGKRSEKNLIGLTEKEKELIEILRDVRYGEVSVDVEDGEPVLIAEIKKSILFE